MTSSSKKKKAAYKEINSRLRAEGAKEKQFRAEVAEKRKEEKIGKRL